MGFEKKLERLEEIVSQMEKGDLELEQSMTLFEEGVKLAKQCHTQLNQAEQKVKKLVSVDDNGNPVTEELGSSSAD